MYINLRLAIKSCRKSTVVWRCVVPPTRSATDSTLPWSIRSDCSVTRPPSRWPTPPTTSPPPPTTPPITAASHDRSHSTVPIPHRFRRRRPLHLPHSSTSTTSTTTPTQTVAEDNNRNELLNSSARSIYNYINYERKLNNINQDMFLSADDFLPVSSNCCFIYIYVVVNSGVKDLEFINQYLWQLCDPDRLGGEGGYYLTVFSSTLSLLRSLNMENIERATMIDDLILPIKSLSGGGFSSSSSSPPSSPSSSSSSPSPLNSSTSNGWNSASISRRERAQSLSLGGKSNSLTSFPTSPSSSSTTSTSTTNQ
ncbi:vacuolar sorting protein 9 domain-containing protein [Heterostelium album PN500]|uniref:Vacuolar sorting protein 9 domain-containing protein n=1 Tax=Heterostelium pallidum (strain ATCC 26659 / Pp 5 / PN500) TaxID=670386 RepID=D3B5C2_HETP5|nr:vacuolar sorting protein 9 domain-containing protein [Heterostelium album PN500]EFA83487.1 vacuolar sorting protein 9 domain-containing protein [Heterostelium album PN500]|eukprot:XP_020435604.1 vacuolar sorting protein 9 domain-containing protein [Heterostelium album PN500]